MSPADGTQPHQAAWNLASLPGLWEGLGWDLILLSLASLEGWCSWQGTGFAKPAVHKGCKTQLLPNPSSGRKGRCVRCQCSTGHGRKARVCLGVSAVRWEALEQRPDPQNKLLLELVSGESTGKCSGLHSKHLPLVSAGLQPWILLHTQLIPDALAQVFSWCILLLPESACIWVGVPCSQWSLSLLFQEFPALCITHLC